MRVRLPYKPKPNSYTRSFAVDMADIRGKERVSIREVSRTRRVFLRTMVETRFVAKSQHWLYYNIRSVHRLGNG